MYFQVSIEKNLYKQGTDNSLCRLKLQFVLISCVLTCVLQSQFSFWHVMCWYYMHRNTWNRKELWDCCHFCKFFFPLFTLFNPFAPENFAEKRVLKLVEPFSGHCLAKKSQYLPQSCLQVTPFVALTDLCSFWYGLKDFFTLHISQMTMLSLTNKTDDVTSDRRDLDLQRGLRAVQGQMG